MMIALPNIDRSFTATLFWPNDGPSGFAGLDSDEAITARFRRDYPDAVPLMPDLPAQFREHPVGALVTVHCWPWVRGRVALIGDAAHAIVPFYGQGMNCGFEDVVELDRCLAETDDDWSVGPAPLRRATSPERRRHRRPGPRQLRRDARPRGLAGLPHAEARRARPRTRRCPSTSCRSTSSSRSRPCPTPRSGGRPRIRARRPGPSGRPAAAVSTAVVRRLRKDES